MVLIDNGGSMKGYQSDITRTFHYGTMSQRQLDIWALVGESQKAGTVTFVPGLTFIGNVSLFLRREDAGSRRHFLQ